jgi:radical SAM superfamily enzyme YgiQ (UPF0313 family)
MYRSKTYRERPFEDIEKDIVRCAQAGLSPDKVFLCDGDALGAPMELLEQTLICLKENFPDLRRVGVYATAENMLEKTPKELKRLHELGLGIAYLGLESGDDKILHMIVKGNTAQEMIEGSLRVKEAGIKLSTIVMLGVGGQKYTEQHIKETARVISETCPHFFSFLTTFSVPGTPYHKMEERGLIEPLTSKMLMREMFSILEQATFEKNPVIFRANHVSNQYPLGGTLPKDQDKLVKTIKEWWEQSPKGAYPPRPAQM